MLAIDEFVRDFPQTVWPISEQHSLQVTFDTKETLVWTQDQYKWFLFLAPCVCFIKKEQPGKREPFFEHKKESSNMSLSVPTRFTCLINHTSLYSAVSSCCETFSVKHKYYGLFWGCNHWFHYIWDLAQSHLPSRHEGINMVTVVGRLKKGLITIIKYIISPT